VLSAALQVYAEVGWAGFTLSAVAARSSAGKAAIYSRWSSKEALIVDAIMALEPHQERHSGSIREDLIATVEAELRMYLSPMGVARLRAQVEAKVYPELFGRAMDRHRRTRNEAGRQFVSAAVERGELPAGIDALLLLDALVGITMNHFLAMPEDKLHALRAGGREFAESVVDFVLRAAVA
jgi:AcrR family transcriptional regulator